MPRVLLALIISAFCLTAAPAHAFGHHNGGILLGVGVGCCGPYFGPSYYGWGHGGYTEPSTIVYTRPAPPPSVTYVQPTYIVQPGYAQPAYYAQPVYVQPQIAEQQAVQDAVPATSASETFTDSTGRTCRTFQATFNGAPLSGTACLQPDGSWRTVGQ